ncbi:sarcosine oxidase subunit gamma [Shimia sp.]|uniref:sarcosine oxidase subunit gamma n=1 Tax=Shimia sp. TaxID=1954381 RepID=UPI00356A0270
MADLMAKSPCEGLLPLTHGEVRLHEMDMTRLTSLAPYRGRDKALSEALKAAHGMALPAVNRATGKEGARAIWFGQGQVMLVGPAPDAALAGMAAMTDQSDAWALLRIEGPGVEEVLARLIPLDLRQSVFKRGHTARTQLQHMMVSITRVGDNAFLLLGFRSMAKTLVHDLQTAMQGVAARGAA